MLLAFHLPEEGLDLAAVLSCSPSRGLTGYARLAPRAMLLLALAASTCAYTLHSSLPLPLAAAGSASSSAHTVAAAISASRCDAPRLQFDMGKMGGDLMKKMGMGGPDSGLSEEDSKAMEQRLKDGEMTFDDFLKQVQDAQITLHTA